MTLEALGRRASTAIVPGAPQSGVRRRGPLPRVWCGYRASRQSPDL